MFNTDNTILHKSDIDKAITIDVDGTQPYIGKSLLIKIMSEALVAKGYTNVIINSFEHPDDLAISMSSEQLASLKIQQRLLDIKIEFNDLFGRSPTSTPRYYITKVTRAKEALPSPVDEIQL